MYMQNNPYQNQQWTPMQQQNTLPPGWEAKWDPGSKRWFYINHITKITQWDAPLHQTQVSNLFCLELSFYLNTMIKNVALLPSLLVLVVPCLFK